MDELIVVTHPEPVLLEARPLETDAPAEGNVALAYYHDGNLLARGLVATEAVKAIEGILSNPVSVALAATEDRSGNIDARFCLVLPVDPEKFPLEDDEDGPVDEPWRSSVPAAPSFSSSYDEQPDDDDDEDLEDGEERPRVALLPIGNVMRNAGERRHPDDIARDLREMLLNLMAGRAKDAVSKAIDDLLNSL
ncbi:MAG: hypothetical protein ACT443_14140 [Gemmatimonadota bacterium]